MSTTRRGRACNICHAIKIKCELGAAGGGEPPCERCLRLGKTCSVSAPMRQKDRIAELEARLEEVTKLMMLQQISGASSDRSQTGTPTPITTVARGRETTENSKKRKLSRAKSSEQVSETDSGSPRYDGESGGLEIDQIVSVALQIQLLSKYHNEIEPIFPFPITGSYENLRREHPLLLQAVILAVSSGSLSSDVQDGVLSIVTKLLAPDKIAKANKSIELVQALLIASFWYRTPKKQVHFSIDKYITQTINIAEEIGISKSDSALIVSSTDDDPEGRPGSSDAWRTWNLVFLLSSSLATCTRTSSRVTWNSDLELKLSSLEYGRDSLGTDQLLCQFVRAEKLCQQIVTEAGYSGADSDPVLQVTDQAKMRRLQNLITDRKAQVFSSVSCASLELYEHTATIFLHECILHTPSNKRSFAAPYLADRLSLTDFPTPVVTSYHIASLYTLRDACHALLNTFLTLDNTTIASSPFVIFTGKALYAQWILIKMHVALTASGNTYGAFLDARSLNLDVYLSKFAEMGDAICALDELSLQGRGLQSVYRLREWLSNCNALQAAEASAFTSDPLLDLQANSVTHGDFDNTDWSSFNPQLDFDFVLDSLDGIFPEQVPISQDP